jgi:hypothetical protein
MGERARRDVFRCSAVQEHGRWKQGCRGWRLSSSVLRIPLSYPSECLPCVADSGGVLSVDTYWAGMVGTALLQKDETSSSCTPSLQSILLLPMPIILFRHCGSFVWSSTTTSPPHSPVLPHDFWELFSAYIRLPNWEGQSVVLALVS